jgi:hypothetical protein
MLFKIFYRLKANGKLYWERYRAPNAELAAANFVKLGRELGETILIVRVETIQ